MGRSTSGGHEFGNMVVTDGKAVSLVQSRPAPARDSGAKSPHTQPTPHGLAPVDPTDLDVSSFGQVHPPLSHCPPPWWQQPFAPNWPADSLDSRHQLCGDSSCRHAIDPVQPQCIAVQAKHCTN